MSPNVNTRTFTPHTCIFALTHTLSPSHSSSHPHTHTLPQEQDEPVLEHLTDIKIIYLDDTGMVR